MEQIDEAWERWRTVLAEVPPERIDEVGVVEKWSVKDLIGHVATWDGELIGALGSYLETGDVSVLAFVDVDELNERTVSAKRDIPLPGLLADMNRAHETAVGLVGELREEVLSVEEVRRRIGADTFFHYDEHAAHVRAWLEEGARA